MRIFIGSLLCTLLVASSAASARPPITVVARTGDQPFEATAPFQLLGAPIVSGGGHVVFSDDNGFVWRFSPDGAVLTLVAGDESGFSDLPTGGFLFLFENVSVDAAGRVVFSIPGAGLWRFDGTRTKIFGRQDPCPSNPAAGLDELSPHLHTDSGDVAFRIACDDFSGHQLYRIEPAGGLARVVGVGDDAPGFAAATGATVGVLYDTWLPWSGGMIVDARVACAGDPICSGFGANDTLYREVNASLDLARTEGQLLNGMDAGHEIFFWAEKSVNANGDVAFFVDQGGSDDTLYIQHAASGVVRVVGEGDPVPSQAGSFFGALHKSVDSNAPLEASPTLITRLGELVFAASLYDDDGATLDERTLWRTTSLGSVVELQASTGMELPDLGGATLTDILQARVSPSGQLALVVHADGGEEELVSEPVLIAQDQNFSWRLVARRGDDVIGDGSFLGSTLTLGQAPFRSTTDGQEGTYGNGLDGRGMVFNDDGTLVFHATHTNPTGQLVLAADVFASDVEPPPPPPEGVVALDLDPGPLDEPLRWGDDLELEVGVSNNSPSDVGGWTVMLSSEPPLAASALPAGCSQDAALLLTCTGVDLDVDASVSLTMVMQLPSRDTDGDVVFDASLVTDGEAGETETLTVAVSAPPDPNEDNADLAIAIRNGEWWVDNVGPDTAENVIVELSADAFAANAPCEATSATSRRCALGSVAVGDTVRGPIALPTDETSTVTVSVSSDTPDPNLENNSATEELSSCACVRTAPTAPGAALLLPLLALPLARRRRR